MLVLREEGARGKQGIKEVEAGWGKRDEKTGHSMITKTSSRAGDH